MLEAKCVVSIVHSTVEVFEGNEHKLEAVPADGDHLLSIAGARAVFIIFNPAFSPSLEAWPESFLPIAKRPSRSV
jgi:hypothetical protein